jgi:hypothetical protein
LGAPQGLGLSRQRLFSDPIVAEVDIDTPLGSGFLECQVRESQMGERYFVLKSRGGEATVFVPLDKAAAKQLADFIQQ